MWDWCKWKLTSKDTTLMKTPNAKSTVFSYAHTCINWSSFSHMPIHIWTTRYDQKTQNLYLNKNIIFLRSLELGWKYIIYHLEARKHDKKNRKHQIQQNTPVKFHSLWLLCNINYAFCYCSYEYLNPPIIGMGNCSWKSWIF